MRDKMIIWRTKIVGIEVCVCLMVSIARAYVKEVIYRVKLCIGHR